jgi:hypothetical protein
MHAEEELLLQSYPQPDPAQQLPAWWNLKGGDLGTVDTVGCSHDICVRAIDMLSVKDEVLADVFALIDELFPLLQLSTLSDDIKRARMKQYMASLGSALEQHLLAGAGQLEAEQSDPAAAMLSNPPVLAHSGVRMIQMIARYACRCTVCIMLQVPMGHA